MELIFSCVWMLELIQQLLLKLLSKKPLLMMVVARTVAETVLAQAKSLMTVATVAAVAAVAAVMLLLQNQPETVLLQWRLIINPCMNQSS